MFSQWIANFTKSPKTSLGGLVFALILVLPQVANMIGSPIPEMLDGLPVLDDNGQIVFSEPEPVDWSVFGLAASIVWISGQSRDADKKSEQVIKKKG